MNHGCIFFLIGVLFPSLNCSESCFCGQKRNSRKLLPCLQYLSFSFLSVLWTKEFWSLSDFCFYLLFFLFLLAQMLQPIFVLVHALECKLVFFPHSLKPMFVLKFFTSVLALAVLRLGFICSLLSFQCTSLEAFWRARRVLKAVCHSLCDLSASAGFVEVCCFSLYC